MQEVAACHVARMLETPPCMLRSLDLSRCGMGDEGAHVLRGALMGHPTMRSLDLSRNRIGITGAQVRGIQGTGVVWYPRVLVMLRRALVSSHRLEEYTLRVLVLWSRRWNETSLLAAKIRQSCRGCWCWSKAELGGGCMKRKAWLKGEGHQACWERLRAR